MQDWGQVISIDHRKSQVENVKRILQESKLEATLVLREPTPLDHTEEEVSTRYLLGQLRHYVKTPHEMVDLNSVDLVFIDGRHRIECALASSELLKSGGLLMIHGFWSNYHYRASLTEILVCFDYLFESPPHPDFPEQGLAVFRRK